MTEHEQLKMAVDAALAKACLIPSQEHDPKWIDAREALHEFETKGNTENE